MMSSNKKRKSDVNIDQVAIGNAKKEKWFDAEQTKAMLAAPLPDAPTTGRRSSFIGALRRMVSGSALRDKNRSMSKLSFSSSSSAAATATVAPASSMASVSFRENSFKENSEDASFASETSQESDHIPVDKIARNSGLAKFVRRSEAVEFRQPSDSSFNTGSIESLDASISSGSVFSLATPSRGMRRDDHRSSVRSMPDSHLVEGLCLSAVRRNPSSVSDGGLPQSPLGKCGRKSFRMLRKLSSSMAELPENAELNTSFAPLAEMDEDCLDSAVTPVAESMLGGAKTESTKKVKRTGSRLFGKKRNSISTPTDQGVSFSANGDDSTPGRGLTRTTPSSSGIHRKVSSALTKMGLIQNSTPTSANAVVVKRTNTGKNSSRPDVSRRNSIATGFIRSSDDEALEKAKQEADLFRKQVRLADAPVPDVLQTMDFDAIIVDCLVNGQAASIASKSLIDESDAQALHRTVMLDPSKQQVIFKRPDKPTLICIKMDSPSTQPIDKRVRVGVGSGLREAFALEGVSRVLAYPMFCMNEAEWNNEEKCLDQLLQMVMHALAWNSNPDKIEYVVLAGLSPEHSALLKSRFDAFVANLPPCDAPEESEDAPAVEEQTEVTETDL